MILHFFKKCLCYQHFLCHSCLSFHYTLQFRLLLILFSSSCFFNKPVVYFFHVMILHQLRETIFMRSLHLISDSKKALSLRTEPYALFCTYKPYYHINSSRPKEYRPHDIYLCLLLETEMISCVNACHYTDDSE
mgnify:CR=1 FL=1